VEATVGKFSMQVFSLPLDVEGPEETSITARETVDSKLTAGLAVVQLCEEAACLLLQIHNN
jgi:hypothetical protein